LDKDGETSSSSFLHLDAQQTATATTRAMSRPPFLTSMNTDDRSGRINTRRKPWSPSLLLFVAMTETLAASNLRNPPFPTIPGTAVELRRSVSTS
jgi:hypothetical protein